MTVCEHKMLAEGRISLYLDLGARCLTDGEGTVLFSVREIRYGKHNLAGVRVDVWFEGPDKCRWHGVQIGEHTQICHCRRTGRS